MLWYDVNDENSSINEALVDLAIRSRGIRIQTAIDIIESLRVKMQSSYNYVYCIHHFINDLSCIYKYITWSWSITLSRYYLWKKTVLTINQTCMFVDANFLIFHPSPTAEYLQLLIAILIAKGAYSQTHLGRLCMNLVAETLASNARLPKKQTALRSW